MHVEVTPPPETVMVPILGRVVVFAATEIVTAPLPDPLLGETLSQELALLEAVQATFAVIETTSLAAAAGAPQPE